VNKYPLKLLAHEGYTPQNYWNSKKEGGYWCAANLEKEIYYDYYSNYMWNYHLEWGSSYSPTKVNSFKNPSELAILADSGTDSTGKYYFHGSAARVAWVHSHSVNLLFLDSHVKLYPQVTEELFNKQ
jgi:prepilin-type processing-associated H-X9-DG protein